MKFITLLRTNTAKISKAALPIGPSSLISIERIYFKNQRQNCKLQYKHNCTTSPPPISLPFSLPFSSWTGEQRGTNFRILYFACSLYFPLRHQSIRGKVEQCGVHFASTNNFIFFFLTFYFFHFPLSHNSSPTTAFSNTFFYLCQTFKSSTSKVPKALPSSKLQITNHISVCARKEYQRSPSVGWVSWRKFMDHK